jgi:hypothetical protein
MSALCHKQTSHLRSRIVQRKAYVTWGIAALSLVGAGRLGHNSLGKMGRLSFV